MPRKRVLPEGWPTKDGRPATVEEIRAYIAQVEAHYLAPRFETTPHFCTECTAPLEHEPCQVCWTHRYKDQVARLRVLLARVVETEDAAGSPPVPGRCGEVEETVCPLTGTIATV